MAISARMNIFRTFLLVISAVSLASVKLDESATQDIGGASSLGSNRRNAGSTCTLPVTEEDLPGWGMNGGPGVRALSHAMKAQPSDGY